jgi:hypothetical protein
MGNKVLPAGLSGVSGQVLCVHVSPAFYFPWLFFGKSTSFGNPTFFEGLFILWFWDLNSIPTP